MLHLHRLSAGSAGPAPTDMAAFLAGPEARRALAATSLEHAQPDLLNSLTRLAAEAEPLLSDMEDTLDALKEMFLEMLRARLTEVGVNVEETRLVVGLDAAGRFGVPDRTGASGEALDAALGGALGAGVGLAGLAEGAGVAAGRTGAAAELVPLPLGAGVRGASGSSSLAALSGFVAVM